MEFKLLVVTSLARRRADSNSSLGMLWVRVRATLLLDVINLINPPRQQEIGTNCLWKGPNASGNHWELCYKMDKLSQFQHTIAMVLLEK